MPPKRIHSDLNDLRRIAKGASISSRAISSTYGPYGRTVVLQRPAGQILTKDGMTILKEIHLRDPVENMGCQLVKATVDEVNSVCGDGSTTTTILCSELIDIAVEAIAQGKRDVLKKELDWVLSNYECILRDISFKTEDEDALIQAALMSSNGDIDVAENVVSSLLDAGIYGHVNVVDGKKIGISVQEIEGVCLDSGWMDERFTQGQPTLELDDPIVAVFKHGLKSAKEIVPCMEEASRYPGRPLVVFAPFIFGEALSVMLTNLENKVYASYGVRAPSHPLLSEYWLDTIAALTGASIVDPFVGRKAESFDIEWLGGLHSISVKKNQSILRSPIDAEERILRRVNELQKEVSRSKSNWMRDALSAQCAMLSEGMMNIEVLKHTETETRELRARIEDTLFSIKGCIDSGFVPGSCNALNFLAFESKDEAPVVSEALLAPFKTLCRNRGVEGPPRIQNLHESYRETGNPWMGWDIGCDSIRHLASEDMVLDSLKCVLEIIRSSISLALLILNSNTLVVKDGIKR